LDGDDTNEVSALVEEFMCPDSIENEIEKLSPEVSKIYFDAKADLVNEQDSRSDRFDHAARIVRAFWKRLRVR
jgi:hypothetical protein